MMTVMTVKKCTCNGAAHEFLSIACCVVYFRIIVQHLVTAHAVAYHSIQQQHNLFCFGVTHGSQIQETLSICVPHWLA